MTTRHTAPVLMPAPVHDSAADTRWRRWLIEGERRDQRRAVRTRVVIIALFVGLAVWGTLVAVQ